MFLEKSKKYKNRTKTDTGKLELVF